MMCMYNTYCWKGVIDNVPVMFWGVGGGGGGGGNGGTVIQLYCFQFVIEDGGNARVFEVEILQE